MPQMVELDRPRMRSGRMREHPTAG